jgi:hypothetical protein
MVVLLAIFRSEPTAQAQWTHSGTGVFNSNSVTDQTTIGINWHSTANTYAIFRTGEEWSEPYAQLKIRFPTGIILQPGEDSSSSYGKSYVEIGGGGKGLMVTTGNVGIGTTNPSTALHVVGDVTVSGNISARYQDLAEWVPSTRSIPPGTVVTLDPEARNVVIPSTGSYDTRVAGVVSGTPGIILGEAGDDKVKVATTGRVKVRVDATKSPIRTGDLLVTSDREGIAMRSEPIDIGGAKLHRPGTLIGKALEPLAEGDGEILVLLSLQ